MKVYQFKVYDENLQKFLDSQESISDFLRKLVQDFKDSKLIYPSQSIDYKLKEARLENYTHKNRIEKVKADYAETFGQLPSPRATNAINQRFADGRPQGKPYYPEQRPQTPTSYTMVQVDGTLKCVTCGKIIPKRAYDFQQADDYAKHVIGDHNRKLYEGEQKICAELANH